MIWRQIDYQETLTTFRAYSLQNPQRHFKQTFRRKKRKTAVLRHKQGDRVFVNLYMHFETTRHSATLNPR